MQIDKTMEKDVLTITIDGRIDTTTAPRLEAELKRYITDEISTLVFNFDKVQYMSSAGIRVIMSAEKVMSRQGTMRLEHVNADILEIFEITGLVDLLQII